MTLQELLDYIDTQLQPGKTNFTNVTMIKNAIVEVAKNGGGYNTTLPDDFVIPFTIGGIAAGTTIGELKGKSQTAINDMMFAPDIDASIGTQESATLTDDLAADTVEVGTLLQPTLNATFNRGSISNGDGSQGPELVGLPNRYYFTGPGIAVGHEILSINLAESYLLAAAVAAVFGSNQWSVQVDHDDGTGAYYNNKGVEGNNLDGERLAGSATDDNPDTLGRYYAFHGVGAPTNSAEVRALSSKIFLDANNTGQFTINVPAGATEISFAIPAGKTIQVIDLDALNANLTDNYTASNFNVNDAGDSPVAYEIRTLSISGYSEQHRHQVTIS